MRLAGGGGSVCGFSSGEGLLIGGGVYFGRLNSGETGFVEVEPLLPGCSPVKRFLAGGQVQLVRRQQPFLWQPFVVFGQFDELR